MESSVPLTLDASAPLFRFYISHVSHFSDQYNANKLCTA